MKTWIDFDAAPVFAIPLTDAVGAVTVCEGMLIEGPQGWGEFSPPASCDNRQAGRWLTAAIEVGTVGWPDPVRGRVPVAVTIPAASRRRATAPMVKRSTPIQWKIWRTVAACARSLTYCAGVPSSCLRW